MKKIILAVFTLIVIAVIYYMTSGSAQLVNEIRSQIDTELTSLETQGFSVLERKINDNNEHFVIAFDEPEKIAAYIVQQGAQLTREDAEALKGLQIGVDLVYLADAFSAVSVDLYLVALPLSITESVKTPEDKEVLSQIQKMLDKKTFLVHFDVNKLGTGFKGYVKDIDEKMKGDVTLKMTLSKLEFSGDIKDESVQSMQQSLQTLNVDAEDTFNFTLNGLKSNYRITGASLYGHKTDYSIEHITLHEKGVMLLEADLFEFMSDVKVKDSLATTTLKTQTKNISMSDKDNKIVLDTLLLEMNAKNLDMDALEELGKADTENNDEINAALQKLVSKGIELEIPAFSVAHIENLGQRMEGFHLNTSLRIDKSVNVAKLQENPMLALNALTANLDLNLSKELYTFIKQQPEAMMPMMLFQPKEVNGKMIYTVELKDGSISVNNSPVM